MTEKPERGADLNFRSTLDQISGEMVDLLRKEIARNPPSMDSMWPDTISSPVRKYVRRDSVSKQSTTEIVFEMDFRSFVDQIVDNFWFSALLHAIATLYIMWFNDAILETDMGPKLKRNLEGEFNETQIFSVSGENWYRRLLICSDEEKFWLEAKQVLLRYFEFSFRFPEKVTPHYMASAYQPF